MREVPVIGLENIPDASVCWGRHVCQALEQLGYNPIPLPEKAVAPPPGGVYATTVQNLQPRLCDGRLVTIPWETDTLPRYVVSSLNLARAIMVPGKWLAEVLVDSGVCVPVRAVDWGIDTSWYNMAPSMFPRQFVFITAGANRDDQRKGIENVIAAFLLAFPTGGAVLQVKSREIDTIPDVSSGRIQFIRENLPIDRMVQWYRESCAYVNGSYGEAWGLHMHEAMACGRPVITPVWGGVSNYAKKDVNCLAVHYKLVPASAHFGSGKWAQPDLHDMALKMRRVVDNAVSAIGLGVVAAQSVAHYTLANMHNQMRAVIKKYV